MPGKPKENPDHTQQEEISLKKAECLKFFEKNGVKTAAADCVGRDIKTVRQWEDDDPDFREAMSRAKATFLQSNRHKLKLDNLFANLYDDFKPPKQELDVNLPTTITINHVHPTNHDRPDAQTG